MCDNNIRPIYSNHPSMDQLTTYDCPIQSILFLSLATSLFSMFLAILRKQWLNHYVPVDMQGSAVERSQHQQQKFNGITTWYFEHMMESLPIMLQFSLLLLDAHSLSTSGWWTRLSCPLSLGLLHLVSWHTSSFWSWGHSMRAIHTNLLVLTLFITFGENLKIYTIYFI